MTSSPHRGRTRPPLARLARFFKDHRDDWWESAAFERHDHVSAGGVRWKIVYKIQARRPSPERPDELAFTSSVTVWPAAAPGRPASRRPRDGLDAAARWRLRLRRELRRHGYRGRWQKSADGRLAGFWKDLPGAAAVPGEVKRLERLRF